MNPNVARRLQAIADQPNTQEPLFIELWQRAVFAATIQRLRDAGQLPPLPSDLLAAPRLDILNPSLVIDPK